MPQSIKIKQNMQQAILLVPCMFDKKEIEGNDEIKYLLFGCIFNMRVRLKEIIRLTSCKCNQMQ